MSYTKCGDKDPFEEVAKEAVERTKNDPPYASVLRKHVTKDKQNERPPNPANPNRERG